MSEKDLEKHLKALVEMCSRINFSLKESEVLSQILKRSCEILNIEGMSILLDVPEGDILSFYAVEGPAKEKILKVGSISTKEGIAGWVYNTGKAIFLNDPYTHPKFLPFVDKETGFHTKNLICVPLISRMKKMGVLEAVNKKEGLFDESDLYFAEVLAGIVSIVLRNIGLFTELAHQKNLVKSILASIPGGFVAIDTDEKVIEFNASAGRILGISSSPALNLDVKSVFKMQKEIVEILVKTLREGKTGNRLILHTQKMNGQKLILGYGTLLIKNPEGRIIGAGMIFQDLTQIQGLP